MLASHEEGDHYVGDFRVGDRGAGFVNAGHEVPDHVVRVRRGGQGAAGLDDVEICLGHFLLRMVAFAVLRKRCPGKHEVYGREAHVEVVVQVGERGVEF